MVALMLGAAWVALMVGEAKLAGSRVYRRTGLERPLGGRVVWSER